jgi:DNA repair exonuclease SbcCD ATPase subunit
LDSSIAESEKKKKENRSNELKLREQKLRKREEELKIREKLSEEMQNERIWLQSYVTKLEGRVNELERSNKILQQKCESMAHHQNEQCIRQNSTKDPSPSNTPTSYIEKTLEKMHEKQQMDKQLDKMFESTNSYAPESSDRVTSTYEPSGVDQKGG